MSKTTPKIKRARWAADLNIQCLFADALMNTMPWDYYEEGRAALGRTLKPRAQEVRQVLERVLAANPNHEGAIHLYIHLLEAGTDAAAAEPYADRLARLAPGASHLVHMPSHTFMHTGRFEAAAAVNADATYVAPRAGIDSDHVYPLHNREFLVIRANPPEDLGGVAQMISQEHLRADRCGRCGSRAGARRR